MSERIIWSKDFSIKNAALDEQHQIIFDITNDAYELANKINKQEEINEIQEAKLKEELKTLIYKMFRYMKIHFKDEEDYMKEIDFPLLDEHRILHKQLMNGTRDILTQNDGLKDFAERFRDFTLEWLLEHFINGDAWIENYKHKALDLNEIHCSLESYSKLHNMKKDLRSQKHFDYICLCHYKIHHVAQSIHNELISKETVLKCQKCNQILVFADENSQEEDKNVYEIKEEIKELGLFI